jgi:hypothetical protein
MESSNGHINLKRGFSLYQLSRLNQVNHWLLTALIFILPCNLVLQANPLLAQEITPSPSLGKNNHIIYVDSQDGDDHQVGKKSSPLQTITHALKVASTGTTIQLAAGTYSEQTGETFPLVIDQQITLPVSYTHLTLPTNGW